MASVFTPIKTKLQTYKSRLELTVHSLEEFDSTAYNSIPEMTKGLKDLRAEIKKELAATTNSLETAEAANAASVAARAPSGIAKSLNQIMTLVVEIKEAAKCFILVGEIIILMSKIPIILAAKVIELGLVLTKLQLTKVTAYLNDLKQNIIKKINDAKAQAITDAKIKFYAPKVKTANEAISTNEASLVSKIQSLKANGKTEIEISTDPTIVALKEQINKDKAFILELQEAGLI